jgi:MFS family permease
MAFMVGTIDYFTISTLEAKNVKLVLDGHISSEFSSRLMQTSIQIGAFSGSFIGGAVVDRFAVDTAVMLIAAAGIVALTLCAFISDIGGEDKAAAGAAVERGHSLPAVSAEAKKFIAALAMIGFHIGAFNCLVPIVYQKLNGWDATQFGLVGGLAGLGAFLGAFLPRISKANHLYLALIVLADFAIVFSPQAMAIYPCAFVLGFSMNQLRIALRKKLIELADTEAMAGTIAARSSFYYLLLLGAAPFVLTGMTTDYLFGVSSARVLMMVPALALALAVLILIKRPRAATSYGQVT